ncbi:hypothetical protein ACFE04_014021 [Oxalis oulophora]
METKKVGIVGAGISGLLACKYTLSKGFTPIVFESRNDLGGVWIKTIQTTKLQSPKAFYQFSDFPWPDSLLQDFPDQQQVLDYIKSYAAHFDLVKHIKFHSKVLGVEYENPSQSTSQGQWKLIVADTKTSNSTEENHYVDFLILCVGRFSDVPNYPEFPPNKGPKAFQGKVIHSMDYAAMDHQTAFNFVKGKRVAIVGFQKSALDIAMECSALNGVDNPCTVLYKTEHWNVPDHLPWGVPLAYFYLNRFSELLVHKPGEGLLYSFLATMLSPLRWAFSKFVESDIKKKLNLEKHGMVPKHSFLQEINSCSISTMPEKFYDRVEQGSIKLKKAPTFTFTRNGVVVDGESEPLEVDLVILATGYRGDKKLKDIFMSQYYQDLILGSPTTTLPLYREMIHPQIPQLAVIGFSESISNLYTSEIRCRWIGELLDGKIKLPSTEEMEKDISKWDKYMKKYSKQNYRRSCIGAVHIWYNDNLCRDMGWNPNRKNGFFADLFEPYGPMDYVSF